MLFLGPGALAWLLGAEANRNDRSIWPSGLSLLLTFPAVLGISDWILLLAYLINREWLNLSRFAMAQLLSVLIAVVAVGAGYALVTLARIRGRRPGQ
jgi:hypothetical protein